MIKPSISQLARSVALQARQAGLTQELIAQEVSASQSQVSRVLAGKCIRRSRLFDEICIYVSNAAKRVEPETVRQNETLVNAIASVWDGTDRQAEALAQVIRSLGGLSRTGGHSSTLTTGDLSEYADS